jgi:hypothetical protein
VKTNVKILQKCENTTKCENVSNKENTRKNVGKKYNISKWENFKNVKTIPFRYVKWLKNVNSNKK